MQRLLRDLDVVHALERDRGERREGVEVAPLLGNQQQARVARLDREHAARAHRRAQRQEQDAFAGSVSVPAPAGCDLSYAHCAAAEVDRGVARAVAGASRMRSPSSGSRIATCARNVCAMNLVAASDDVSVCSRLDRSRANS